MACSASDPEARSYIGDAYSSWPCITTAEILYGLPPWFLYCIGVQETTLLGYGTVDSPSSSLGWGLFQQTSTVRVTMPGALASLPNEPCQSLGTSCGLSGSNAVPTHFSYRPYLMALLAGQQLSQYYVYAQSNCGLSGDSAWEWAACRYNGSESGCTPSCAYGACVLGYLNYVQSYGVPYNGTVLSGTSYPNQR